jgi:transcription initiation factor TFIIIB Brf1 subunit/transcription initiation factor TFIIB
MFELKRMRSEFQLPKNVVEQAAKIYRKVLKLDLIRYRVAYEVIEHG